MASSTRALAVGQDPTFARNRPRQRRRNYRWNLPDWLWCTLSIEGTIARWILAIAQVAVLRSPLQPGLPHCGHVTGDFLGYRVFIDNGRQHPASVVRAVLRQVSEDKGDGRWTHADDFLIGRVQNALADLGRQFGIRFPLGRK